MHNTHYTNNGIPSGIAYIIYRRSIRFAEKNKYDTSSRWFMSHNKILGDDGIRSKLKFREALTFQEVIKKCACNQHNDRRGRS